MRPTWAEINLTSIKNNLETVKSLIHNDVSVLAVVKADAYGHGAVKISNVLIDAGINSLGVATLEEGLELREAGIKHPILILGGIQIDEVHSIVNNGLTPTIYDIEIIAPLSKEVNKINKHLEFHLKIDTGMSRLGIKTDDINNFLTEYRNHKCLKLKGIFTHLANADNNTNNFTNAQISRFNESLNILNSQNIKPDYFHLANSAAIQNYPESHGNLVRPGIMLYGAGEQNSNKLCSVMRLKSKILQIKMHDKGTPVSYGGTYIT
ncbi:MAG: alanine racemase, partial [Thermodesulfobacteriota bacterium]